VDKAFAGLDVTLSANADFSTEDVTVVALGQRDTTGYAKPSSPTTNASHRKAAEIHMFPIHVVKPAKIKAVVNFNPV
jgi:hypothetical protein